MIYKVDSDLIDCKVNDEVYVFEKEFNVNDPIQENMKGVVESFWQKK